MANSPARATIDLGSVIADTYKIEALIGRGGMGAVFVASHNRLPGKKVAIKLLHAELHDQEVMARFRREAEIASKLGHPNIVTVHDFNIMPDGTPYLVLEYLEGETLAQKIQKGPVPIEQVMSIIRQVGSALAAAHREGIVHRDLKPQNIFLIETEVDGRLVEIAKVLDFGISKIRGSQTVMTQESTLLGTPQYMAPEQATGQHDSVDQRTDVFALGAIVYEMLCGQPAFSGASIPEVVFKVVYEQPTPLRDTIPPAIADAVKQAMSKPAGDRFLSVAGFVEALTGVPLANFRLPVSMPELGFASGSKRVSNPVALANTMGSGEYTPPPKAAVVSDPPVRGSAPTVASQPSPLAGLAIATPSAAGPQPRRKRMAVIMALLAGVAAIMYFVMRSPDASRTVEPNAPDTMARATANPSKFDPTMAHGPKPDPSTTVASNTDVPSMADAPGSDASHAPPPDVGSRRTKVRTDVPTIAKTEPPEDAVDAGPANEGDMTAREQLRNAEIALSKRDYVQANLLANAVVNSSAKARHRAQAYGIKGVLACLANNDGELAKAALRSLPRSPAIRARIIDACRNVQLVVDLQ